MALLAGVMSALAYPAVRELRETDTTESIVMTFSVFCTRISTIRLQWRVYTFPRGGKGRVALLLIGQALQVDSWRHMPIALRKQAWLGLHATVLWSALIGWAPSRAPGQESALGITLLLASGVRLSRKGERTG